MASVGARLLACVMPNGLCTGRVKVGQQYVDAFSEGAQAGVAVYLLVDAVRSVQIEDEQLEQMQKAGAKQLEQDRWRSPVLARLLSGRPPQNAPDALALDR